MIFVYYKNSDIIDKRDLNILYTFKKLSNIYYINNKYLLDINNNGRFKSSDITYKLQKIINGKERITMNIIDFSMDDILLYYYLLSSLELNYKIIVNKISTSIDKYLIKFDNLLIYNNFIHAPIRNIFQIIKSSTTYLKNQFQLNFSVKEQMNDTYGYHRFGWGYVKSKVVDLNNNNGVHLDLFMEKTFLWNNDIVYDKPWYGIMHNPQDIPKYLRDIYNIKDIIELDTFKQSKKHCKGILVLSNHLKQNLEKRIDIPIYCIKHPTPHHIKNFNVDLYCRNKKVVHVGYWLRNYNTFHQLKTSNNKKILLEKTSKEPWLKESLIKQKENQIKNIDHSIEIKQFITNDEYDELMMSSIIFLDLIDTSANNIIVECIQYQTPLLINKHPAIVEYLGEDYPFYYESMEEANQKIDNIELIKKTTKYLKHKDKTDISIGHFLKELVNFQNIKKKKPKSTFNIGNQLTNDYGKHRSGWKYVVSNISNRIKDCDFTNSIYFDTFMERTFCWGENYKTNIYNKPWTCIIHNPPNIPHWSYSDQNFKNIIKNKNFLKSIPYLKKIITLSDYCSNFIKYHPLIKKYNIHVYTLYHPTEIPNIKFNIKEFKKLNNRMVVQIGWWLRKLHSIFLLPSIKGFTKVALGIKDEKQKKLIKLENKYEYNNNTKIIKNNVVLMDKLSDHDYDILLSKSIVFVELYDSSANNLVIECIARNTPILINPVGGVVDYLGKNYPFYFNNLNEASRKLKDINLIENTYYYLKNNTEVNKKISFDNFYNGLVSIFN